MRSGTFVLTSLAAAALMLAPALPAAADEDGPDWSVSRYDVSAILDPDGTAHVTLAFDFHFGSDPDYGPLITLPLRQENDPDHWRMLDITVGQVSSSSGANAEVVTWEEDGNLLIRVGSFDVQPNLGVQSYTVSYTIRGLIATNQASSGLDEFNWNVIGTGWEVPISNVSVTITGPVDVVRTACFSGGLFSSPCGGDSFNGTTARFSHQYLNPGEPLRIVAGFPGGTFTAAEPRLTTRFHVGNMFAVTPLTGGLTAALSALGLGLVIRRTRRGARDEVVLGLTPGVVLAAYQPLSVGKKGRDASVAVHLRPPAGARPGELGVLTDHTADNADIAATVVDMAVRGYLRIEETGRKAWRFTQLAPSEGLVGYERKLVDGLFREGPVVGTRDLRQESYGHLLEDTRGSMYSRVTDELHWFPRNPRIARGNAVAKGLGLVIAGAGVGVGLGALGVVAGVGGFGLLGLAGVIAGIGVVILSNRFGARTAAGSAVLAQTKGFELYLSTAEADQITFEEGIDVFSRYLPYAMVFGVAERWTTVFQQLQARGRYLPSAVGWYVGTTHGFLSPGFASSIDQFAGHVSYQLEIANRSLSRSHDSCAVTARGAILPVMAPAGISLIVCDLPPLS